MPALSGTAAGAERAQIRPPRVKEGGSDTAKRCFRGPHELAFIRSKIFIYPQFASSDQLLYNTRDRFREGRVSIRPREAGSIAVNLLLK